MALYNNGSILCCSTAAGPAFEGAEISCGMGGVCGAISAVSFENGRLSLTTLGNISPHGICGSGLIDAVAVMLKQGIVDETGLMKNQQAGSSGTEFFLAQGVSITGRDIRQFQIAKSAIRSGISILCKNGGVKIGDIKKVYIAGGFGFFINRENAVSAGLFPKEFLERISVCGNLSLQGAEGFLVDNDFSERCKHIISRCSVIDLSLDPDFMDEFADNMIFG
jgi:uncharacterized 2Fe-2S/4Fe-4S cluster protein (DUF4445 family)